MRKFPSSLPTCLGQFWLYGAEEGQRTGSLRLDGSRVELEVSPALIPQYTYTEQENGTIGIGVASDPDDMVVLGSISASPGRVTLWGVHTTGHHSLGWPVPGAIRPESHAMRADWCIAGSHYPDPNTRFFGVQLDVTNLTEWAWQPSLTERRIQGRRQMTWEFSPPESLDELLVHDDGYIALKPALSWSSLNIRGVNLQTRSDLEVELIHGWTLLDCLERLAIPVASLMTLLSGATCEVRTLSVWSDEGNWSTVHGYNVIPGAPMTAGDLLLHRTDAGLDFLARWLKLCERITPVPQILSAVVGGELPTVEAEALALVTTIEALHRTLYPDARRFSEHAVTESLSALSTSTMPTAVRDSFTSALGTWWPEYSYPMRVRALAEPVAEAVPDCVGKLSRWKTAVVEQRVSLAHGLGARMRSTEILRMHSLNRSIRWTLLVRLLLEAGVAPAVLRRATSESEKFERDRDEWRAHWPSVFDN